jgi:hypothetical protein
MARKGGINFTVGGTTVANAETAFDRLSHQVRIIHKHLGELTRPFDKISSHLVKSIKQKFDNGTFNQAPDGGTIKRSRYTKSLRKRRNIPEDNPRLKSTGALRDSIKRITGPTAKQKGVEDREVLTLRIGSAGVPYAKDQLMGGVWEIPIILGEMTKKGYEHKYIDWDGIQGTPSNSQIYGKKWAKLSTLRRETHRVHYPGNDIFGISSDNEAYITRVLMDFFQQAIKTANEGGGGVVPF